MADFKYGRLLTSEDVQLIVALATGADDPSTVDVERYVRELVGEGFDMRFRADEPLFLLRAACEAAPQAVALYAHDSSVKGKMSVSDSEDLRRYAVAMTEWQFANPDRVKAPDA